MTLKFLRTNFNNDPNIGMYGFGTDKYLLLGMELPQSSLQKLTETLKAKIMITTIASTELAGLFAAGNSTGIVLPRIVEDFELKRLKELDLNMSILDTRETALGNLVLCNDKGCLISGSLRKFKGEISDALGCEVEIGKVSNLDIVGSCAVVSNVGCLCHREAQEEDIKKIEEVLKVKVDVGSISYGSPYVKSGIMVNSNGIAFSEQSTGAEIGRLEEVFE